MNHLSTAFSPKPKLEYPFEKNWSPPPGEPCEVVPGVYWLRVPLPIALDHINLWILRDGDGWTIVDSGYDAPLCKNVWEQVFSGFLKASDVKRIIVTHFHPDHIGLASWLAQRCDCPIWISQGEFRHYHSILTRETELFNQEVSEFLREVGFDSDAAASFTRFFETEKKPDNARVQESMCQFVRDGDELLIDDRSWRVVSGNGHSPEHSCLYSAELQLMISGDQSIPRISSNVSVYPSNRHQDPLGDWLSSCEKLRDLIPNETLILPSHQEPFRGNVERMQQMIDDHHAQLNRLRLELHQPMTVCEARKVIFTRELNTVETLLATGETLAHLNYLWHRDELVIEHNINRVAYFSLE